MELILGSQSSARANLLKEHGIEFEQKALYFDEESLKPQTLGSLFIWRAGGK